MEDFPCYASYLQEKEEEWETLCLRCGASDDPCKHLKKDANDIFFCEIYPHRFGLRETVGGEKFFCVPVREVLHSWWPRCHLCAYKKKLKIIF